MATKTFEELKQLAIQIRDEKTNKANTATRIGTQMIEHLNKLEQEYYNIQTVDGLVSEYNVSVNHPTSGIDGSNKYTLSSAIALVPEKYRSIGIKCSFLNEDGDGECWEYKGELWVVEHFKQIGSGEFIKLEKSINYNVISNVASLNSRVKEMYLDKSAFPADLQTLSVKQFYFRKDDGYILYLEMQRTSNTTTVTFVIGTDIQKGKLYPLVYNDKIYGYVILGNVTTSDDNVEIAASQPIVLDNRVYDLSNSPGIKAYLLNSRLDNTISNIADSIFLSDYAKNGYYNSDFAWVDDDNYRTILIKVNDPLLNFKILKIDASEVKGNIREFYDGKAYKTYQGVSEYNYPISSKLNLIIALYFNVSDYLASNYISINDFSKVYIQKDLSRQLILDKSVEYIESGDALSSISEEDGYMTSSDEDSPLATLTGFKTAKFNANSFILTARIYCIYGYDAEGNNTDSIATGKAQNLINEVIRFQPTCSYIKISFDTRETFDMKSILAKQDKLRENFNASANTYKTTAAIPAAKGNLGHLAIPRITDFDICHFIMYGQSLSCGTQSANAITTNPIGNAYMLGGSVWDVKSSYLNPLKATVMSGVKAEDSIVSAVNSFTRMYRRYVNTDIRALASSVGVGGYTVAQLSKKGRFSNLFYVDDEAAGYSVEPYENKFLKILDNAKKESDRQGLRIGCPAIIYMQGEADWGEGKESDNPELSSQGCHGDKELYKQRLLQLKNDMQADIMDKYGQSFKPLFFIYQTCGKYIYNINCAIPQAQKEFAEENDDVILMNPTYFTPDFSHGHLSTNGYRWYGEHIAKFLWHAIVNHSKYEPVTPVQFIKNDASVEIYFRAEKYPLVIDTVTLEEMKNYGFMVYKDGVEVSIESVNVIYNKVVLNVQESLSTGKIAVSYAGILNNEGTLERGQGNIRDSADDWKSLYTYWNDSEEKGTYGDTQTGSADVTYKPTQLYGKPYPMWNWVSVFYQEL